MTSFRLTLEYDGSRYRGWQEQRNARTVAGEVRRAAEEILGESVELGGSGRTDAGVHALAQEAHLRVRGRLEPEGFRREMNERLAQDIHLLRVRPVDGRFHARHSATERAYLYQISRRRTAFAKRYVWWVRQPLALDAMRAAASLLAGRHDFAAFCERPDEQSSTLVQVSSCEIAAEGSLILVRISASHFLWKMVRRVVGALVRAGSGELSPRDLKLLLAGSVPADDAEGPARWTAPPSGLFLEGVLYAGDPPLGALRPAIAVRAEAP